MIYISKLFSPISTGTSAGDIDVGAAVKINENGQPVDYLIVHQGLPSDIYDASCEGTWVLRKDILENIAWGTRNPPNYNWGDTSSYQYLNSDNFINIYEKNVIESIKQVKIPYQVGDIGTGLSVRFGEDGLPAKIFWLSGTELGFSGGDSIDGEGAKLEYFKNAPETGGSESRIAFFNGQPSDYYTRSPANNTFWVGSNSCHITTGGDISSYYNDNLYGNRPCIILHYDFKFQEVS